MPDMGYTKLQPTAEAVAGVMLVRPKRLRKSCFQGYAARPPNTLLSITFAAELDLMANIWTRSLKASRKLAASF